MGVLSCLTTGWWAQFSDRHGRTRVMGIGLLGFLFYDLVFIVVAKYSAHLPGGYWNLIWGNLVEGCLGGFTAAMAAYHAYIADTTLPGTRSHIFSLAMGLVYIGMAIGPALGSMVIAATGEILSVFYLTALVHLCFVFYIWILMPESLAQDKMGVTYRRYFEARALSSARGSLRIVKKVVSTLDPLRVLVFPSEHAVPPRERTHEKRNYNLAYIAAAYGFSILLMGLMSYQFQYATWTFHWETEELGFFLSLVSAVRAAILMIILPVLVRYLKHRQQNAPIRLDEDSERSSVPPMHDPSVDIMLLRVSLFLEIVAYIGLTVVRHPTGFIAFSVCNALGSGVSPAAQSLALEAFTAQGGHESGRLFGALSVIQALSSQIVGPALFGFVYMATVSSFPSAIFGVSAVFLIISFVFSCLVRSGGFRPTAGPLAEEVDRSRTD
ncbi:major facilitator superfamily domain-containing protein [Pterulicium gracile]|uniref:Major facilitator superfamily domain-containing protein n=1 Tax=Pterulicium gracile TaxID=1884261 RepID=A0A5C3R1Q0_9AGAR|nr:major facilitator superfamily domain-containing protein [Pterula gracilis]